MLFLITFAPAAITWDSRLRDAFFGGSILCLGSRETILGSTSLKPSLRTLHAAPRKVASLQCRICAGEGRVAAPGTLNILMSPPFTPPLRSLTRLSALPDFGFPLKNVHAHLGTMLDHCLVPACLFANDYIEPVAVCTTASRQVTISALLDY